MAGSSPRARISGGNRLLHKGAVTRYAFAVLAVGLALVMRMALAPYAGWSTPLTLSLTATLVTGFFAGAGPALLALVISLLGMVYGFVLPRGEIPHRTALQLFLYTVDGVIVVYLTHLLNIGTERLEEINVRLVAANDERARALERTRETIELAPDAYVLSNLGGNFITVNREACRILGYDQEELMKLSIYDLVPEADAPRLEKVRAELLVPGTTHTGEWTMRRKDGTFVPTEVSANIIHDGRWQAFIRDITERKRIEKEAQEANARLRESEERFRLTIDEAPIGMTLVALDGHFVRVNKAFCDITGYAPEELYELTYQDITHPDDLVVDVELARRVAAGEIPRYQLEKRYIRKDGSIVDIMLSVAILRGPGGEARYYISQVEDISERKRAEAALRRSEAKFSGIVSIAADAIISVDEQQRITIFNEGAENIFGYTREEIMGAPLETLIPERFREVHRAHFARFAAEGHGSRRMGTRLEVFGLRKNGEEFPAEGSISRVEAGHERYFSVVLRDVTDQKKTQRALERAVTARDEVLGIVAHDLRNPLNTILMQASSLERPEPEPERRDMTPRAIIVRSVKRMNRLIQDLLDVASIEAGHLKVECTRLEIADLLHSVRETQAPLASAAGLDLRLEVAPDVRDLSADRDRLLEVFENLIGNAIKFTPRGGHITVRAVTEGVDDVFSVADTGSGISQENLKHIFDRFWQATKEARRLGAGLGLPITKGIIEAHGGRIWVDSTVGKGTTFHFTIPAAGAPRKGRSPQSSTG